MADVTEVVAVEDVHKQFGDTQVLRGLTFNLEGPQVIGILGPNGAGKTTLLDLLEGLSEPSRGRIRILGEPLTPGRYPRARVGVVLQRECSFEGIRVGEYAELFASIYAISAGRERILRESGLQQRLNLPLSRLSGGEAQRLYLAAATVHDPELLFCDEPTAHLDPAGQRELAVQLRAMGKTRTVVMTTHDLREAESICDQVIFLVQGEIKAYGSLASFVQPGSSLEEAFFRHCAVRISRQGDVQ